MDNEQPHQELVKCVVVGDTAVGKTRLICARACNSKLDLSQCLTTHIPTVWAIDQYRIHKEVIRACFVCWKDHGKWVDKVNVSLRLWDTFGDHDKDRRFAYGRSDVVLLCFSISNPISLRNCKAIWYPEIRRFCPNTPIVLVGCKNDLRHMYRDEKFLSLWQERSPFFRANHTCSRFPESRPLRECDILTPEQGRQVANEINAPYYETSVFTHFGVNEVFENVIRIALIARRQQRFWMTNLKPVQSAMLQKPFCPPRPNPPKILVPPSQFKEHMRTLLTSEAFTDVTLNLGETRFQLHKIVLASASSLFHKILTKDALVSYIESNAAVSSSGSIARSASDSSISSSVDTSSGGYCNTDTESLIRNANKDIDYKQSNRAYNLQCAYLKTALWSLTSADDKPLKKHASCTNIKDVCALFTGKPGFQKCLQHPLFNTISIECSVNDHYRKKSTTSFQSVLRLSNIITENALRQCLHYLYTGSLFDTELALSEMLDAAELFELSDLVTLLKKKEAGHSPVEEFFCEERFEGRHLKKLREALKKLSAQNLFADVSFQFDDGVSAAHKPILMARCDMMDAMFRGAFRESCAKMVQFPGVKTETFRQFLHYVYTDEVHPNLNASSCLSLVELANRLCLPRLIALVEEKVINELNSLLDEGIDVTEYALKLLEPCQVHNADQLADWCLHQISVHYKEISHKNIKLLRSLHPENQAYLNRNRWPPVWYLKELEFYERCMRERLMKKQPKGLKRHRLTPGCLCFSGKSKRKERIDYSVN